MSFVAQLIWLRSVCYDFTGVQASGVIIVYCYSAVSYGWTIRNSTVAINNNYTSVKPELLWSHAYFHTCIHTHTHTHRQISLKYRWILPRNCGIPDPSWSEIRHFVSFLNSQLRDCEQSVFCDMKLMREILKGPNVLNLEGFRSFVVRFMIQMSRVSVFLLTFKTWLINFPLFPFKMIRTTTTLYGWKWGSGWQSAQSASIPWTPGVSRKLPKGMNTICEEKGVGLLPRPPWAFLGREEEVGPPLWLEGMGLH